MQRLAHLSAVIGAVLAGAVGCSADPGAGSGPPTFPAAALMSLPSDSGDFTIEVRTSPEQPPSQGIDAVEYRITGKGGAPVDGLSLDVVPWMPAMGHGASSAPVVAPGVDGQYVITDVEFFMAGKWVLRTAISGSSTDSVTPSFEIP